MSFVNSLRASSGYLKDYSLKIFLRCDLKHYKKYRTLLKVGVGIATLLTLGCATAPNDPTTTKIETDRLSQSEEKTYSESELLYAISNHLGVTSESAASALERLFSDRGRPVGYITGQEGSGAAFVGARYGQGTLWMKDGQKKKLYWQGPSIGFDGGMDVSKVFTLVYGLEDTEYIYQRFPGADGAAYLVAGMAVNYQYANGITLAPVRSGVGIRLGANVNYTSYTRNRSILPL